jgi:hypothetical protein
VIAILAAILDDANPSAPRLQGLPQITEGFSRHVGMTHDVVLLTKSSLTKVIRLFASVRLTMAKVFGKANSFCVTG